MYNILIYIYRAHYLLKASISCSFTNTWDLNVITTLSFPSLNEETKTL